MSDATIQQILMLKKKRLTPSQIAFVVGERPSIIKRILNAKMINKQKVYSNKFDYTERKNWLL